MNSNTGEIKDLADLTPAEKESGDFVELTSAQAKKVESIKAWFYPQGIPEQKQADLEKLRNQFAILVSNVVALTPEGRRQSMVLSDIERAAAMATKAISHG